MKIALTGTSSTGKTTLAQAFRQRCADLGHEVSFLTADARNILRRHGFQSMDLMTPKERASFQQEYLSVKESVELNFVGDYVTDRSFVDVAAYWRVRDMSHPEGCILNNEDDYLRKCRQISSRYDMHFYLPWGVIPFKSDGYRSTDLEFHREIDECILAFLRGWDIPYIVVSNPGLEARVNILLKAIAKLSGEK